MATVIDALVVTLGLNSQNFSAGSKQARSDIKQTSDESTRAAKEMEARGKQAAQFFSRIRNEALGLFAVITAGRGLKSLVADITTGDAATGRLAHNLNISTAELSEWQGAAERTGGSAEGMGSSLMGLSQQFQQLALTGQSSVIPYFRALGVQISDAGGKMRPMRDILLDLADKFQGMDPARATALGSGLGLDQGTINLLETGRANVLKLLDEQRKLGVPSDDDAKRAQEIENRLKDLRQAFLSLARTVLNEVTPSITSFLTWMTNWIETNGPRVKTEITDKFREFFTFIRTNLPLIEHDVAAFAAGADAAAKAVGGWQNATEILFGLWLGAKFIGVLANVASFTKAVTSTLPGWLLRLAPLLLTGPAGGEDPEFSQKKNEEFLRNRDGVPNPTNKEQDDLAQKAVDYFVSQGRTPEQAAGIVGNLQQESSFNTQAGLGSGHVGLAQWDSTRQAEIAAHFGKPVADMNFQEQLNAIQWELTQGRYKNINTMLNSSPTEDNAAAVIDRGYESPGHYDIEDPRRAANARRVLENYHKRIGAPKPPAQEEPLPLPRRGAPDVNTGARSRAPAGNSNVRTNTSTSHTNINAINVNAPHAKDGISIAASIQQAMTRYGFVPQANTGLA